MQNSFKYDYNIFTTISRSVGRHLSFSRWRNCDRHSFNWFCRYCCFVRCRWVCMVDIHRLFAQRVIEIFFSPELIPLTPCVAFSIFYARQNSVQSSVCKYRRSSIDDKIILFCSVLLFYSVEIVFVHSTHNPFEKAFSFIFFGNFELHWSIRRLVIWFYEFYHSFIWLVLFFRSICAIRIQFICSIPREFIQLGGLIHNLIHSNVYD